ncbi:MAG: peptidase [Ktedonobacteraceae bacterium]
MPRQQRLNQLPLVGKILLGLLAGVYLVYLVAFGSFLYTTVSALSQPIIEHQVDTNPGAVVKYWTTAHLRNATDADQQIGNAPNLTQGSLNTSLGKAAKQLGQPPLNGNPSYPLSTVGKVFFSNASGRDFVCSGTAVASLNQSVVDTAGHCIYWNGDWVQNLIFCPLYESGSTPYGCWAARDLEAPSDWIHARPNDYHHDLGMAIVSPNSQGTLTDLVGGAGWAYNQPVNQPFYAYGYPAAGRFDGQTRQSCDKGSSGKSWKHGGGTVVSIPCDMTGGSSGGPWFMKSGGDWYLNGHNDFTSSMQPGHMFSPYYDDTWYALYDKAQHS